jgi:nucleoside-diphosphate kinase
MERTLVILKPDAVQRGLIGRILQRFEDKGLKVVAARFQRLPGVAAREALRGPQGQAFYKGLVRFMSESPVLLVVLEGAGAIALTRKMMGAPSAAMPSSARSAATSASRAPTT